MKKKRFIFILFLFIVIFGCSKSINNEINKGVSKVGMFHSLKISDRVEYINLEITSRTWLSSGLHLPYFFGKISDTIPIGLYLRPIFPPFSIESDSINQDKFKKGKFDDYYRDWLDSRRYVNRDSADLIIKVDTTQIINNWGRKAYPILIQNQSIDTIYIGYGAEIPITTEAKNRNGVWKPIVEEYIYMCGNGVKSIVLPPNEVVITSELIFSGDFETKLRIKMGNNYSEEFNGSINETQFVRQYQWDSNGKRIESSKI